MEPLCRSRPIGRGGLAAEQFAFGYAKGVGQRDQVAAPRHRLAAFPRPDARLAEARPVRQLDTAEAAFLPQPAQPIRSEEHTSELQSLMRISYAVFCLKKKINTPKQHYH